MPNDGIVMPAFDDGASDRKAFDTMTRLFPKREIVQIPALELAYGGGGIHSFTLPQPAGPVAKG
jgi:agmatine deiminase